jgi:hypothetical protein
MCVRACVRVCVCVWGCIRAPFAAPTSPPLLLLLLLLPTGRLLCTGVRVWCEDGEAMVTARFSKTGGGRGGEREVVASCISLRASGLFRFTYTCLASARTHPPYTHCTWPCAGGWGH